MPVLLEQGVDPWDAAVPRVLQVLQRQTPVLGIGLLTLQPVLRPHSLAVDELTLPRLDVPGSEGVWVCGSEGVWVCGCAGEIGNNKTKFAHLSILLACAYNVHISG